MDFSKVKKWKIPVNGVMKEVKQVTHDGTVLWKGTHVVTWRWQASYGVWTTTTQEYDDGAIPSRDPAVTVVDGNIRQVFDAWDDLSPVTEDRTINAVYHIEYNVTQLNGTNCNAYQAWGWTTPFTTGWHRATDKIYWYATAAYCYSWTGDNFIEWETVDVVPGVNSSSANLVKRWGYDLELWCPYQADQSVSRGYAKVWRTSSPYQHAELSTESSPLLYTTEGRVTEYVYYGDVLSGKTESNTGWNLRGYSDIDDRSEVLETFTDETVLSTSNTDWTITIYPNPYELALVQNYGEWDSYTSRGDEIGHIHLDGESSDYPIVFVHTGTEIAYGYDHDGAQDPTRIAITDYVPEYDNQAYDIAFNTPGDTALYNYTLIGITGATTISGDAVATASVARQGIETATLHLNGSYGSWSCDDPRYGSEISEVSVHIGDAVIISGNTVTVGPNPVGPYTEDVITLTWTTQPADHDYSYIFNDILFYNGEETFEILGSDDSLEAEVTQSPNPFTVTWRWQDAYNTWTTATETLHYGDTPSRAVAPTVTSGNVRNYSLGWDDLSDITDDRTINATYKPQYNVTSLSGTHCSAYTSSSYSTPFSTGWYDTNVKIYWKSTMPYCFDYSNIYPYNVTTSIVDVAAGVNSASATNVYRYQYFISLHNPNSVDDTEIGYMKIWRTSSPYAGAETGTESNPTASVTNGNNQTIWAYSGDVFNGKAERTNIHYNLGDGNTDTIRTFSNRTVPDYTSWIIDMDSNVYNIFLTQTVPGVGENLIENLDELPREQQFEMRLPNIGAGTYSLDFTVSNNISGTYSIIDETNSVVLQENIPFTQGANHRVVDVDAEYYEREHGIVDVEISRLSIYLENESGTDAIISAAVLSRGAYWNWDNYTTVAGTTSLVPVVIAHYGATITYDATSDPYITIYDADNDGPTNYTIDFTIPTTTGYSWAFDSFSGPDEVDGDVTVNAAVARHSSIEVDVELYVEPSQDPEYISAEFGHWEDENGDEISSTYITACVGDAIIVSNNTITIGPNPVGPYSEYVHTYTWVTATSPTEYTYTFNRLGFAKYDAQEDEWIPTTEVPEEGVASRAIAYITVTPNPFTVSWHYQTAYGTWTTVTDSTTYRYGDTPSRANPSNVTGTNARDINGSWDNLTPLTESIMARTIEAQYTRQYNVTSLAGTNCSAYTSSTHTTPFTVGWYNAGTVIYWLASAAYAFNTNNLDSDNSTVVAGVNSNSAPYVKHWDYRIALGGTCSGYMKVWRTSSPYQGATEGSTESDPLLYTTNGYAVATVYYGDILSGKAVANTGYNFGLDNDDNLKTFSGRTVTGSPDSWHEYTEPNTYELELQCNYGEWDWEYYDRLNGEESDYPIVEVHYGTTITCEDNTITISDDRTKYGESPYTITFNAPSDTSDFSYEFLNITAPSIITANAVAIASVARLGSHTATIVCEGDRGHWIDSDGNEQIDILAYDGDYVDISGSSITVGPNPAGSWSDFVHTYTWITDSSDSAETISFDHIEFTVDGEQTNYAVANEQVAASEYRPMNLAYAYCNVTSNPGKVYVTAGTGVTSVYTSTSATATSGHASGTYTYPGDTLVYVFAVVQAGYHRPGNAYPRWELISGTEYEDGAIYRVDYWSIAGDKDSGTINAVINTYTLSGTYTNGSVSFKNANNQVITSASYGDTITCIGTGNTGYNSTSTTKILNPTNFTLNYSSNPWTASISLGAAARIYGSLSQGNLPTGVASITCYRKPWDGNSYSLFTSGRIYYGDQFYWVATATTGYNNPTVTYGSSSNPYTWTGSQGGSITSVSASGLVAGSIKRFTVTWKNWDGTTLETDSNVAYGSTPSYDGATPTRARTAQYTYTFSSWSPEQTTVTSDQTYTAQFSSTVNKYTVTWKNWDGSTLETDTNVPYGSTVSYDGATPTRPTDNVGVYTFHYWTGSDTVTGNLTKTAQFDIDYFEYDLVLSSNYLGDYSSDRGPWRCFNPDLHDYTEYFPDPSRDPEDPSSGYYYFKVHYDTYYTFEWQSGNLYLMLENATLYYRDTSGDDNWIAQGQFEFYLELPELSGYTYGFAGISGISWGYHAFNSTTPTIIAQIARLGDQQVTVNLDDGLYGHWEDSNGDTISSITALNGDYVSISGATVTVGPNPVGEWSEYVHTYTWVLDTTETSQYNISFNHIEFTADGEPASYVNPDSSDNLITPYCTETPKPGRAYIAAGTGVSSVYLSTTSTATSGAASGTQLYNGGDIVYGFAVVETGYVIPSSWTQISGSKYRVDWWEIAGDVNFGTINLDRISGRLSQGTLPTGVSGLTCKRKPWNGNSYSTFTSGTIYYGDKFYWEASATTGYYNPSLTYYDSSHAYSFTGPNSASLTSVATSGLSAGGRRTWSLTITKGSNMSKVYYKVGSEAQVEVTTSATLSSLDYSTSVVVTGTAQSETPYNYGTPTGTGTFSYSSSSETQSTTVQCTRTTKSYTLTISTTNPSYGTYSVAREASPYEGASTGALSNGATIYYGDKLVGTSSGNGVSYGAWSVTSVTTPTVTSTGDATTGNITVKNNDSNTVTLYYNTTNTTGGTSLGDATSGATKSKTGLSFSTTYYCSAARSRTRDKYNDTAASGNYTGTNSVTGNVTASFSFSRAVSEESGVIYSSVASHTTAARNSYVLTVNRNYYKITGVNSASSSTTAETAWTHTYYYGESYSYSYAKTGYTTQSVSGTITGTTTKSLVLSPTQYTLGKVLTNWTGAWYTTTNYSSTITWRYYGYAAYFRATPNAGYYADYGSTHYYTGVYYTDSVEATSTSNASVGLVASALGQYTLTINVTNSSYGTYSVSRTYTESGQGTGVLSNGATIYQNDVLSGTSSGNGTSYTSWSVSSVTAPTVTSTGASTTGNITVKNNDSSTVTLYYNTSNAAGGTSLGSTAAGGTKTKSGLSFSTTYYCSAYRQATRTKHVDSKSNDNYTGTNGVSGNVTASFVFSRSDTTEYQDVWSSVTSHTTAARNTYTVTWKNWDGTTLETDSNVPYGGSASYGGSTPTRPTTAQYTYTFRSWSGSSSYVTSNVTRTAQFDETLRDYAITVTAQYLSDYSAQGISPWINQTLGGIGFPNDEWTMRAYYGTSVSVSDITFRLNEVMYYYNSGYDRTDTADFEGYLPQDDGNYSYSFNGISGITDGGQITGNTTIALLVSRVGREITVYLSGSYGYWQGYNEGYIEITAHYGDPVSVSGNRVTIGSTTYTWVTSSGDSHYTYSFDYISNDTGESIVTDGCGFSVQVNEIPKSGAVTVTAGTGVSSIFLSTDGFATSGSPSGTTYPGGTRVYVFAVAAAGYYSTEYCTGGTQYDTGAIYRVDFWDVAGPTGGSTYSLTPNPTVKWTGTNATATLNGSAMTSGTAYSVLYNSSPEIYVTSNSWYYISSYSASSATVAEAAPPVTVNNSNVFSVYKFTYSNITAGKTMSTTTTAYYSLSTSFNGMPYSGTITYPNGTVESISTTTSDFTKYYSKGTLNYSLTVMSKEVYAPSAGTVTSYGKLANGYYPYGYPADDRIITGYTAWGPPTINVFTDSLTGNWLGSGNAYHRVEFSYLGTDNDNHRLAVTQTNSSAAYISGINLPTTIKNTSTGASVASSSNRLVICPYSYRSAGALVVNATGFTISPATFSFGDSSSSPKTVNVTYAATSWTIALMGGQYYPVLSNGYSYMSFNYTDTSGVAQNAVITGRNQRLTITGKGQMTVKCMYASGGSSHDGWLSQGVMTSSCIGDEWSEDIGWAIGSDNVDSVTITPVSGKTYACFSD